MALQKNFSTQISDLNALKRAAARAGYVQSRGPEKGEGSIRALLEAIAKGEVKVTRTARVKPDGVEAALRRLEAKGVIQRPARPGKFEPFTPVKVAGEPVSEMIIRERR